MKAIDIFNFLLFIFVQTISSLSLFISTGVGRRCIQKWAMWYYERNLNCIGRTFLTDPDIRNL